MSRTGAQRAVEALAAHGVTHLHALRQSDPVDVAIEGVAAPTFKARG